MPQTKLTDTAINTPPTAVLVAVPSTLAVAAVAYRIRNVRKVKAATNWARNHDWSNLREVVAAIPERV